MNPQADLRRYDFVLIRNNMWDLKRQIVWLTAGIAFGTFIVYTDARDEMGKLEPQVFVFWEVILLGIIALLFFIYSRKNR